MTTANAAVSLAELTELVKATVRRSPGLKVRDRIAAAARMLQLPRERVEDWWYGEVRRVEGITKAGSSGKTRSGPAKAKSPAWSASSNGCASNWLSSTLLTAYDRLLSGVCDGARSVAKAALARRKALRAELIRPEPLPALNDDDRRALARLGFEAVGR